MADDPEEEREVKEWGANPIEEVQEPEGHTLRFDAFSENSTGFLKIQDLRDNIGKCLDEFLNVLARTGRQTWACRSIHVREQTIIKFRKESLQFAEAYEFAMSCFADNLAAEAVRRGAHGVQKPVFFHGQLIAIERHFSDNMLMAALKVHHPVWREALKSSGTSVDVNVSQTLQAGHGGPQLDEDAMRARIASLPADARAALQAVLAPGATPVLDVPSTEHVLVQAVDQDDPDDEK